MENIPQPSPVGPSVYTLTIPIVSFGAKNAQEAAEIITGKTVEELKRIGAKLSLIVGGWD